MKRARNDWEVPKFRAAYKERVENTYRILADVWGWIDVPFDRKVERLKEAGFPPLRVMGQHKKAVRARLLAGPRGPDRLTATERAKLKKERSRENTIQSCINSGAYSEEEIASKLFRAYPLWTLSEHEEALRAYLKKPPRKIVAASDGKLFWEKENVHNDQEGGV